jgi:hypothetical protein
MKALTKKEIREELKRLGINSASEVKVFLKEYKTYFSSQEEVDEPDREPSTSDIQNFRR